MKKLSLILVFALMVSLLAGCAGTPVIYYTECNCPEGGQPAVTPAPAPQETPSDTPAAEGALKTGLHISANVKDSKSATADEDGEGKYDVTMVAVLVDDDGIIRDCVIDGIAASVTFDTAGAITSDLTAPVQSKNQLGDAYNMVDRGGATFEWYQQAENFSAYVTGKTAADVAGIAIAETTKPAEGTDLAATVTISIIGFQNLIAKAAA